MRTVCFDIGGVLVEINHHWKGALLDAGFPEELASRFDHPLTESAIFNEFQRGTVDEEGYYRGLAEYFQTDLNGKAKDVHNAILRQTYPGVPELIRDVHAAGLQTGCLSNTNAPHWELFFEPRLAVLGTLHHPMASHILNLEKPDPAIYEAFEKAAGARPDEIAYFEDGPANVDAALARGWKALRIDPNGDPAKQMREYLVKIGFLEN